MKSITVVCVGFVAFLTFARVSRADDTVKTDLKTKQSESKNKSKTKVEMKEEHDQGAFDSTKDSAAAETDVEHKKDGRTVIEKDKEVRHSRSGLTPDRVEKSKEKTELDSSGNVIKHESEVDKK